MVVCGRCHPVHVMIPNALLAFLYALSLCLVGVFAYCLWELKSGWATRGRRPYAYVGGHRWEVEVLNRCVIWFTCTRCGAVGVRGERVG